MEVELERLKLLAGRVNQHGGVSSVVVVWATQILMGRCRRGGLRRGQRLTVEAMLENGLYALEAYGADGERAAASGLQALGPVVACPERIRPRAERKPWLADEHDCAGYLRPWQQ
jgi:hypothetical protein